MAYRHIMALMFGLLLSACNNSSADLGVANQNTIGVITGKMLPENPEILGTVIHYEDFPATGIKPRNVDIWLPPDYVSATDKFYPVIYMHDGQNLFETRYSKYSHEEWGIDETMTRLIEEGIIEPAIIVGIWSIDDQRFGDLLPQKAVTPEMEEEIRQDIENFHMSDLRGDAYLRFIVEELKPQIDAQYRTLPDQANTFIMGSSMGGLMSCYAMIEYPSVFGGAGCVSTHWPLGDGFIADYFTAHVAPAGQQKFYFDFGTETLDATYEPYQRKVDAVMLAKGYTDGVDWMTRKYEGHPHSETAWRERVHVPLTFLLGH